MRLLAAVALAVIAGSLIAGASLIANLTGIHYQNDAGSGRDAPDVCNPSDPERVHLQPEANYHGLLVPADDEDDFYAILVPKPNTTFRVAMDPAPDMPNDSPYPDFDLALLDQNCVEHEASSNASAQPEEIFFFTAEPAPFFVRVHVPDEGGASHPGGSGLGIPGLGGGRSVRTQNCHPPCNVVGYVLSWTPN